MNERKDKRFGFHPPDKSMGLKRRGKIGSDRRITVPNEWADKFPEGTFYEMETYGEDKILITFFKVNK